MFFFFTSSTYSYSSTTSHPRSSRNEIGVSGRYGHIVSRHRACRSLCGVACVQLLQGKEGTPLPVLLASISSSDLGNLPGLRSLVTSISVFGAALPSSRFNPGMDWQ